MPRVLDPVVGATPTLERLRELCDTLESSDRSLQDFFDLSPDLLAVVHIDGFFINVNPSWQKLLGWTEDEMYLLNWIQFVHPDDQVMFREAVGHLVSHDLDRLVCRLKTKDGQYRTVEFSATKWKGGNSNFVGRQVPASCLNCPVSPRATWSTNGCGTCKQARS